MSLRIFHKGFFIVLLTILLIDILNWYNTSPQPDTIAISDFANYSVAMLQYDNPALYSQDAVFGNGVFTAVLWRSTNTYMQLYRLFYHLTGDHLEDAALLLRLLIRTVFISGMYLLLMSFFDDWRFAILMALIASESFMYRTLPSGLYYGLICFMLYFIWHSWLNPALDGRHVPAWRVALLAIVAAASTFLVNSVNGLTFNGFIVLLLTLQLIIRRLPLRLYALYLVICLPVILLLAVSGTGGAVGVSEEAARLIARTIPMPGTPLLPLYAGFGLAAVTALLAWIYPSTRIRLIFIVAQAIFWHLGGFSFAPVVAVLLLYRAGTARADRIDYAACMAISTAVFMGPVMQYALYAVWQVSGWSALPGILWQMYRFRYMAYFPATVLLYRALAQLIVPVDSGHWRLLAQITAALLCAGMLSVFYEPLLLLLVLALALYPIFRPDFHLNTGWPFYGLVLLAASVTLLATFSLPDRPLSLAAPHPAVLLLTGIVFAGFFALNARTPRTRLAGIAVAGLCLLNAVYVTQEAVPVANDLDVRQASSSDYLAVIDWIKANTPVDSMIFTLTGHDNFRPLSQRSTLTSWMDYLTTIYTRKDPVALYNLYRQSGMLTPPELIPFAVNNQVDYVVTAASYGSPQPYFADGVWYIASPVYQNTAYAIYRIEAASDTDPTAGLTASEAAMFASGSFPALNHQAGGVLYPENDTRTRPGIEKWLLPYLLDSSLPRDDALLLAYLLQNAHSPEQMSAPDRDKWNLNFLPGELKHAGYQYLLVSKDHVENLPAFKRSLLYIAPYYRLVKIFSADAFGHQVFLLFEALGDATEDESPVVENGTSVLPPDSASIPVIIAAVSPWRAEFTRQTWLNQSDVLTLSPDNLPVDRAIEQQIAGQAAVFYMDDTDTASFTPQVIAAFKSAGYAAGAPQVYTQPDFTGLEWRLYRFQRMPDGLEARFTFADAALTLTGVQVDKPAACDKLSVITWWETGTLPAAVDASLQLTLVLTNTSGEKVAQVDGKVGEGALTASAGSTIFDIRSMKLPDALPAGQYQLRLGLYYLYPDNTYSGLFGASETATGSAVPELPVPVANVPVDC